MEKLSQETEVPLLTSNEWHPEDGEFTKQYRPTSPSLFMKRVSFYWTAVSRVLLVVVAFLLLINTFLLLEKRNVYKNGAQLQNTTTETPKYYQPSSSSTQKSEGVINDMYRSLKIPITQQSLETEDGRTFSIKNKHWTKPLGKEILIMDVDTRPMDQPGEFLSNRSATWESLGGRGGGNLNHFMYAQIHGYDYKFMQTNELPDRYGTWARQPMMLHGLETHRIVVSMDADAIWNHPEIPLEWMFNHWDFTPTTSFAMAGDWDQNPDSHGLIGANGGFVVAQQNPRTHEILNAWIDCPTGVQFPDCKRLAYEPFHEQTAFNEYIRYAYNETGDYVQLSCDESDGFSVADFGCSGVFVSHFWRWKDGLKSGISNTVMRPLVKKLFEELVENKEGYVEKVPMGVAQLEVPVTEAAAA